MKITRATEQDIEALQQLAVLIEHPSAQLFDEDDPQNFDGCNPEHLTMLWDKIVDISRHGYLTRAAMNLSALLDPDNEILDFAQSALELSPKLQQGLNDTKRLDWLAKNDCALTENLGDEDGDKQDTPFAVIHVQEEHFEVLAAANNIRQAIDTAMQAQAAEAEAT